MLLSQRAAVSPASWHVARPTASVDTARAAHSHASAKPQLLNPTSAKTSLAMPSCLPCPCRVEGFERATDKTSAINFAEYEHLVQSLIDVVTRPNPSGLLSAPLQQQQELFRMRHGLPDMAAALGRLLTHKEEQDSSHSALEATWRVGGGAGGAFCTAAGRHCRRFGVPGRCCTLLAQRCCSCCCL